MSTLEASLRTPHPAVVRALRILEDTEALRARQDATLARIRDSRSGEPPDWAGVAKRADALAARQAALGDTIRGVREKAALYREELRRYDEILDRIRIRPRP